VQILLAEIGGDLQRIVMKLNEVLKEYGMKVSSRETKTLAVYGCNERKAKVIMIENVIESVKKSVLNIIDELRGIFGIV
jgi:sugar-specific transcriptional regulator TrmB